MSQRCAICGKGPQTGFNISHSHHKTKMRQLPNLQKVRVKVSGKVKTLLICTRCLRSG